MKAAIFDMDGLLFDSERLFMEKLSEAMSEYGYTLNHNVYLSMLGANTESCMKTMCAHYGADYPYTEISHRARTAFNQHARKYGMPIKPGITHLLKFLKSNKIICAVASSTTVDFVKEYLQISGLDKYFNAVVGGDMVTRSKPNPDIFLKACELLGASPSEAVVFEDSENGILAAVNGDIAVICIPDMKHHNDKILSLCAGVAADGNEAAELIDRLYLR